MEERRIVLDKRKRRLGEYCLRCGTDRGEIKRVIGAGCYAGYGGWYARHFFGRRPNDAAAPINTNTKEV